MPGKKPISVDDYLAGVSAPHRAALVRLRKLIRAAVPGVEEGVSYGIPGFRLGGKWLLWMGAAAKHCALYGIESTGDELAAYDTSGRGTLRFLPEQPLPEALVRKLVATRVAKTKAQAAAKKANAGGKAQAARKGKAAGKVRAAGQAARRTGRGG